MQYFKHRKVADGLYAITDAAMTTMYLLVGSEGTVLMDTGGCFGCSRGACFLQCKEIYAPGRHR